MSTANPLNEAVLEWKGKERPMRNLYCLFYVGLLVAGQEGLVNGMVWGAAFGILGGLAVTSTFDSLAFWNGFFSRFNKSKFEDTPDDRK